ncbi:MAG: HU family DNA-binding protein [Thermotogae bacterium]|nr:HU family DNA-binding protein [Thermotogota bacterium]MCP5465132.1 HU family DNA-binding protein [Thermotogota bacterium]HOO76178.1 HU family DNA-binding protein [Tepiditoga sp.]
MNKKELVGKLSEKIGVTKKDAGLFLDSFLEVVSDTLVSGESVKLVGFGTFETVKREPRKGINPQTKKPIKIPGRTVPKFKPGAELKDRVK